MKINIKKVSHLAKEPTYATDGSACFDLFSVDYNVVTREAPAVVGTGLAFEVPKDHAMLLFSRSGWGFADGVRLANCVGVIDSDYRGEVQVKLHSDLNHKQIDVGDRIAQGMIVPVEQVQFLFVDDLPDTDRGVGGFGSTGVK